MISDKKIANAVSGKTARACDCCLKKRARWYCPADDAFLCQSCDGSVHSANPLARRHDRVRLKTASLKHHRNPDHLPTWQRGAIRKTRTPRHGKSGNHGSTGPNPIHTVPELGVEETTSSQDDVGEEQLLYRVPTSDNCYPSTTSLGLAGEGEESDAVRFQGIRSSQDRYLPSDMDLEEFAADVETLLGKELDEEAYGMEQLGLLDDEKDDNSPIDFLKSVKAKDEGGNKMTDGESDDVAIRKPLKLSFDYDDQDLATTCEEQKVELVETPVSRGAGDDSYNDEKYEREKNNNEKEIEMGKRNKMMMRLRLDYEAISEAWGQGSPWMNGHRPQINHHDCWPHCMGGTSSGAEMCMPLIYVDGHQMGRTGGHGVVMMGDGGREARVSRYREKRRTRLFAKKIRYEVRKLNAEKRPRMKGRFVKRSSFAFSSATTLPSRSK